MRWPKRVAPGQEEFVVEFDEYDLAAAIAWNRELTATMTAPAVIERLKEIATEMTKVATEMTKASTLVEDLLKQMSHARAVMSGAVTINYLRDLTDPPERPVPNVRTLDLTEEVTP